MPKTDRPSAALLRKVFLPSLFTLIAGLFFGCSVGTFIGAYFNTYYNAKRLFIEAEDEVLTQMNQQTTRQTAETFLPPFAIQQSTRTKLTSVIEKCSKLLQYHPESDLVDDALFMVGKAYYYQDENQKSERKFNELIEGYPQSDLIYDARLLLSHVYYKSNNKPQATAAAKELLEVATKEGKDEFTARAALLLAEVERENKNYDQAISYYQISAERAQTAEERTTAYMKIADVCQSQGDYGKAAEAYRRAEEESSTYTTEFRSKMGQARMLSKLGKQQEAYDLLVALRSNTNNRDFFGEIDLEIASTLERMNELETAIAQYNYVDTTYARTEISAKAFYQLGLLYENRLGQFDSARAAYNRGRNEFPSSELTPLIVRRAEYMNRYASLRSQLARFDSIRSAILNPPPPVVKAVDSTSVDSTTTTAGLSDSTKTKLDSIPVPKFSIDSVNVLRARLAADLGGLFYSDIGMPDSARYWFRSLLTEFPNNVFAPRVLFLLAQTLRQDTTQTAAADSLYRLVVLRFPDSEFAAEANRYLGLPQARKKSIEGEESYAHGEQLLFAGNTSAALDTFNVVVQDYPSSRVASKAQYALGWIYEQMKRQPDSAIAHYERLVAKYPTSEYAAAVKAKLAEVENRKKALENAARKDSTKSGAAVPVTKTEVAPPDTTGSSLTKEVKEEPKETSEGTPRRKKQ